MNNHDVKEIKIKNIIDMAFSFTTMGRNFEANSSRKIKAKLFEVIIYLDNIENEGDFKSLHQNFCYWMMENVKTAKRRKNQKPSFGQAAKVLDITLKVVVYYCHLSKSENLSFLNSAVDTPILRQIKKKFALAELRGIQTISQIDEKLYRLIQKQIRVEIDEEFGGKILAIQYDDIIWRSLNR